MASSPVSNSHASSAYIHVPFCIHRCGYCDFTVVANRDDLIGAYLEALSKELEQLKTQRKLKTLFLGGGTPTYFEEKDLERLMELLGEWFSFEDDYEWSVEANPAGLSSEKVRILSDAGVNRVSLGVQSFDKQVLKFLERDHRRTEIDEAIHNVKKLIDNLSIDLIFAVPGQSTELWKETLQQAVSLGLQHVSTYGLTIEKGTGFWSRFQKKEFLQADEDTQYDMYRLSMEILSQAGLSQYELSNFARPGFRCLHNEVYWHGEEFFGFGPGAASFLAGKRRTNHRSVTAWIKKNLSGESAVQEVDELNEEDRARERLIIGLRLCEGVDEQKFQEQTGFKLEELSGKTITRFCDMNLLEREAGMLRLTDKGRFLADSIFVDLL